MDKAKLLALLRSISETSGGDQEASHCAADQALIDFIDDPEITAAWKEASEFFWYA